MEWKKFDKKNEGYELLLGDTVSLVIFKDDKRFPGQWVMNLVNFPFGMKAVATEDTSIETVKLYAVQNAAAMLMESARTSLDVAEIALRYSTAHMENMPM